MIKVEGYKAFRGTMRIVPQNGFEPFELEGEWLYKPDTECWYCNGRSFPGDICEIAKDTDEKNLVKKAEIWNGQSCCPSCDKLYGDAKDLKELIKSELWNMPFCKYCGQALDWSEDK